LARKTAKWGPSTIAIAESKTKPWSPFKGENKQRRPTMNGHGHPSMHLNQSDSSQAERFCSLHSLHYVLPDNQTVLMLSGIVDLNLKAPGWSEEAANASNYREELILDLALPTQFLGTSQSFKINQAVPYLGLNSLSGSANTSWGVNNFSIETEKPVIQAIRLHAKLEVSRSSEVLQRIAYQVTAIGLLSN